MPDYRVFVQVAATAEDLCLKKLLRSNAEIYKLVNFRRQDHLKNMIK